MDQYKKFVLFLIGTFILILGVTLILKWWPAVVLLFQGGTGIILAISGLMILYYLKLK